MNVFHIPVLQCKVSFAAFIRRNRQACIFFAFVVLTPALALAESGSPFDTGFTALQTPFTGTIAKVASLIAIVIGGYEFAHGVPGAKRNAELSSQRAELALDRLGKSGQSHHAARSTGHLDNPRAQNEQTSP